MLYIDQIEILLALYFITTLFHSENGHAKRVKSQIEIKLELDLCVNQNSIQWNLFTLSTYC